LELTIFDNIIFGPLQPWQAANQNEQRFSDLVRQAGRSLPGTASDLNKKLSALLQDYPDTRKHINKSTNTTLPLYLYSVQLPRHFNSTTEYYSLLMQNSALHFMQLLTTAIDATQHDDEAYYLVNTSLDKIKYMAAGAATELESRNLKGIPDYKTHNSVATLEAVSRNTHFIFYNAMQHSIRLFFDLQKRYEQYVKATETEEQFYIQTIKENYPEQSPIEPTVFYFEWKVQKLIDSPEYSLDAALQLLDEIKQSEETNKATNANTSLENYIFAHSFDVNLEELQVANLANFATSAKYFEQVKHRITNQVNSLTYGHQRFDVVTTALNEIAFYKQQDLQAQSALSKLQHWLSIQAEAYKGNLSNSFAVVQGSGEGQPHTAVPLTKTDKTSLEDLKQQTQEFLKHFSGYNIQQQKIMTEPDYNRLLEYTFYLIEHETLPKEIKQIPTIGLSGNHIRYTYYQMHKQFYGSNEIKAFWIDFLQKVFKQLSSQDWQTIKTKFSTKPAKYDQDISKMNS